MSLADLPAVNAGLNSIATLFLIAGYIFIRRKNIDAHRKCMLGAFTASVLFLASYLTYHTYVAYVLKKGPTIFRDPEWFRPIYLAILGSHTLLAIIIVPMVFMSLYYGFKRQDEKHKRIARWTWPVWMYVSITGVLIYFLLYQIFPQAR